MNLEKLSTLYHQPLFDLIAQSRAMHLEHWRGEQVQRCSLLSIKTGGCSEDCAYCAQSAHYSTGVEREQLLSVDEILIAAKRARKQGATRFCMGAAWRGVRDGTEKFEQVIETVREVSRLGMEVCVTLGRSATPKRASSKRRASPLTITTSIPRRNFIPRSSARTRSAIGSTPSPRCREAECRFVAAGLPGWANQPVIDCA